MNEAVYSILKNPGLCQIVLEVSDATTLTWVRNPFVAGCCFFFLSCVAASVCLHLSCLIRLVPEQNCTVPEWKLLPWL